MRVDEPVELLTRSDALRSVSGGTGTIRMLQVSAEPIGNLGGVGLLVLRLIRGLPSHYRVDLACPDANSESMPKELKARTEELFLTPFGHWSVAEKSDFVRQVRSRNYDLIQFHGGTLSFDGYLPWRSPLHALAWSGIPWIYTNHCAPALTTGLFFDDYPLPGRIAKTAVTFCSLAWLMTMCPKPIFVSCENQQRIASYFPWTKRKFVTIYPSGLEGEPPEPEVREPVITIGNLGHIAWRKGQFDLLEAFSLLLAKFPQLKLLLVGPDDSDCADRIRSEIAKRGLQSSVSMPGGTKDPQPFWDKVDIYVQPSHYEGAPMALMEAVWQGKPAVGTRVSGIPEIIEHEVNGLLVDAHKPAQLAAAIERLIRDSELRKRFSTSGPAHIRARGMTRPQMIERYLDVYAELLARRAINATRDASQ